ncbi:MAG: helix-turn-helix domain-containing protein [Pirellulales bacterium]
MSKAKAKSIDEQLRQAILNAGESVYAVAQGSGVSHPVLYRFLAKERDLRLESAAKLCQYLGLELAPIVRKPRLMKGD